MRAFRTFGHHDWSGRVEETNGAMLCLGCGAEMRLVEAIEDTAMLVSGYEHQTWQCLGCSSIEERTAFSRKKRKTRSVLAEAVSGEPAPTATDELIQVEGAEPAHVVQAQAEEIAPAELSEPTTAETRMPVGATDEPEPLTANHPEMSASTLQTSILPKTVDERLRYLTRRVNEFREAAALDKRRAEFYRDWDNPGSAASALSSPKSPSPPRLSRPKHRDEPLFSPPVFVAAQAPTPREEPVVPDRGGRWSWKQLLRYGRRRDSTG